MKKSIIIIGIIACAALMVSCNKTEIATESKQGHPVTLTLSIKDLSTKTELSVDGGVYHRVWKKGDKVSVMYSVSSVPKNELFTLIDGAGTTTGTFGCTNSELTDTQYDIHFLYPYTDYEYASSWWDVDISTQHYGVISYSYIGDYYDIMYGSGYYKDGAFTFNSPLSCVVYYLHIPKNTTIVSGSTGNLTVSLTLSATGSTNLYNHWQVSKTLLSTSHEDGDIVLDYVNLTDGALQNDVYIAAMSDNVANETFTLTVKDDSSNQCTYNIGRGAGKYLYNGQVYHLSQTNFTPTLALE